MSAPLESPNFKNLYLGDENDDDAAVISSYVTPAADGPPNVFTEAIPEQDVLVTPPVLNRLLNGYQLIQPTWNALQILPADEFRIMLMLKCTSILTPPINDGISFADNPNSLTSPDGSLFPGQGARINPSDGWVNLGPYTGAIAVTAFGATNPINVSWVSVTK